MSEWIDDRSVGRTNASGSALFSQTMSLVALTVGVFTLAAYLGRSLSPDLGFFFFVLALVTLFVMRGAVRRSESEGVGWLFVFGAFMGLSSSPTLAYYANVDPQALWHAGGATALFMLAMGAAGYTTRRDLSGVARALSGALLVLILFGLVLAFTQIPAGATVYSIAGLVIFAGLTMSDFQRLRRNSDIDSAPLMATSIFLDLLNVFTLFLGLGNRRR